MLKINKERQIAKKITELLNKRGFIVKTQISKKTKSMYLTIDNGACGKIRISDHKNNLTTCKFNVIKNYQGKRIEFSNRILKKYYNFNSLGRLVSDIEIERSNFIMQYGYANYRIVRDRQKLRKYQFYDKNKAA